MGKRVVRDVKSRAFWDSARDKGEEWLPATALRGDAYKSLGTTRSRLSMYVFDEPSQLERILAAIAATRANVQSIDYVMFDYELLESHGFRVEYIVGEVNDPLAAELHVDLVELSARRVMELAYLIYHAAELCRAYDKQIGRLINQHIAANYIDRSKLAPELLKSLGKGKYAL